MSGSTASASSATFVRQAGSDSYLAAADALGVEPGQAAVFEDALSGVAAGRAGAFVFVRDVDRVGQAEARGSNGADRVVTDLEELLSPVGPT